MVVVTDRKSLLFFISVQACLEKIHFRKYLNDQQPAKQLKILNDRQSDFIFQKIEVSETKNKIECFYIDKESSSYSEASVRSENLLAVYAQHRCIKKLATAGSSNSKH